MSTTLPAIPALGTVWLVEVFEELTDKQVDVLHKDISLFLNTFENKYSRFKPDSLISAINRFRSLSNPDQETLKFLECGRSMYAATNGIFNLLVGEVMVHRGYDANYSFAPSQAPVPIIPSPLEALLISFKEIKLLAGQIDLGGYGKGYAIDLVAKHLQKKHNLKYFLINGGGDIFATSDKGTPINIYLEHPTLLDKYIAETTLKDQGFAASSTSKRRWRVGTTTYTHIVATDTKTAHSTKTIADSKQKEVTKMQGDLGIYVKAPTATLADVWSTTILIKPDSKTPPTIDSAIFNISNKTLTSSKNF